MVYSFDALCVPLQRELCHYARRLTGGDASRASDIVQDAILRAFVAWPKWQPENTQDVQQSARGWLYRIVSNTFVNEYAHRKHEARAISCNMHHVVLGTYGKLDQYVNPEDGADIGDEVKAAYENLEPYHQEVIRRRYWHDQEQQEIAVDLKIPTNTASTRLHRARSLMRLALRNYARTEYRMVAAIPGSRAQHVANEQAAEAPEPDANGIETIVANDNRVAL